MGKYSLISLFSGAGGMDLGFEKAGFKVEIANEYDSKICPTYRHNHSHTELIEGDIRNIDESVFPEGLCGIIGGPPCPDFSVGGKNKGAEGKHGRLSQTYMDLICRENLISLFLRM